jgi:hypothetical protein
MALRDAFLVETRSSSLRSGSVADRSPASTAPPGRRRGRRSLSGRVEPARRSVAVLTSNPSGSTPPVVRVALTGDCFVLLEPLAEGAADKPAPWGLLRRAERATDIRPAMALLASRQHLLGQRLLDPERLTAELRDRVQGSPVIDRDELTRRGIGSPCVNAC